MGMDAPQVEIKAYRKFKSSLIIGGVDMAEEVKKEAKKGLGPVIKVLVGVILIVLGAAALINWWWAVWTLIRGCLGFILMLVGVMFLAVAKE